MRSHGMMDIPKENMLAKERLLSMLFYKDADERFSFRYINEELVIIAVHLPPLENKKFTKGMIRETLKIKKGSMLYDNFDKYYKMILDSWMTWIGLPMPEGNETIEHQYVVYKTIKIIRTYKQYYKVSGNLFSKNCNLELFKSHMEMMHSDTSHVTLKLRRCLFKLKFNLYRNGERDIYKLDDAFKDANKVCNEKKTRNGTLDL